MLCATAIDMCTPEERDSEALHHSNRAGINLSQVATQRQVRSSSNIDKRGDKQWQPSWVFFVTWNEKWHNILEESLRASVVYRKNPNPKKQTNK